MASLSYLLVCLLGLLSQQGSDSRVGTVAGSLRALSNVGGERAWMGLTLGDFEQTAEAPGVQGNISDTERERREGNLHSFHFTRFTFSFC